MISQEYNMLDDLEKGYIAGILDGEGCITIKVCNQTPKRMKRFTPELSIASTSKKVIEWLKEKLKITSSIYSWQHKEKRRMYRISIWKQREIRDLLYQLLPLLIIKKEEAYLMIEFILSRTQRKQKKPIKNISSKPLTLREQEIIQELKLLKKPWLKLNI